MKKAKNKNTDVVNTHHIEWNGRKADISFTKNGFKECKYVTKNKMYDLEDWEFLGKLSQAIVELGKVQTLKSCVEMFPHEPVSALIRRQGKVNENAR